ncbi:MAG: histidine phosphatase family protein [Saprospiraceae bacterium]|nr:histidine phosphatase family protein [Saprospiraceae bacterium]
MVQQKEIFFIRHAKSDWSEPGMRDFERPLNGRGNKDASSIGEFLKSKIKVPYYIYCSSSQRTRETCQHFVKIWNTDSDAINFEDSLYHGSLADFKSSIRSTNDEFHHIVLIAHNPTMDELVRMLTKYAIYDMPTCGVIQTTYRLNSWRDFDFQYLNFVDRYVPKEI